VSLIVWSSWGLLIICSFCSLLALAEFYRLLKVPLSRFETILIFAMSVACWAILVLYFVGGKNYLDLLYIFFLALPVFGISLLYRKGHPTAFLHLSYLLTGIIYIFIPMVLLYISAFEFTRTGSKEYNYRIVLGMLILTWGTDTFAYFSGRFLGKHKIFPRISPKKTWEGFIGGVAGTTGVGFLLNHYWSDVGFNWIVIAVIGGVVGLYGDLAESMLKRNLFVKDSGSFLPGHGGILDRFDSVLFCAPVMFLYIYFARYVQF
jgi:phosphatidate cytidylyltransferase